MYSCIHVFMYLCICVYVSMYLCIYVSMCLCIFACSKDSSHNSVLVANSGSEVHRGTRDFSALPIFEILTKGFHFFKKNCHEDKILPERNNTILADIQLVNKYNTFLMKFSITILFLYNICPKRKDSTS